MKKKSGFTLVELLVVIAILSTLFVVLLQTIASGQETADEAACRFRLQNVFTSIKNYEAKTGRVPPGGGIKFLHSIWKSLEPTERNRDLFFCTEVDKVMGHDEIKAIPLQELWRTSDDFTSESTDYAARAPEYRKNLLKGTQAIVADDNEGGNNHRAGTVNVLYGDGMVKPLLRKDLEELDMWDPDDPDFVLPVGPESPHPDLKKLTRH